jgi:hypothetical protein
MEMGVVGKMKTGTKRGREEERKRKRKRRRDDEMDGKEVGRVNTDHGTLI